VLLIVGPLGRATTVLREPNSGSSHAKTARLAATDGTNTSHSQAVNVSLKSAESCALSTSQASRQCSRNELLCWLTGVALSLADVEREGSPVASIIKCTLVDNPPPRTSDALRQSPAFPPEACWCARLIVC
jgi:hypothetical protein